MILTEPEVIVSAGASIDVDRVDPLHPGILIASELVLLAQVLAARFCQNKGLDGVYSVASVASENLIESDSFNPAIVHAQRKLMSRPTLQTHAPESGEVRLTLGQPLDRIEDLLVHQQLSHFLATGGRAYAADQLQRLVEGSRWARDAAGTATRWSRRYWILKWLESKVGERVDAVVLERAGTGLLVELTGCRLKVFIPGGKESWAAPGDAIHADLTRVSARRDVVELHNPRPRIGDRDGAGGEA